MPAPEYLPEWDIEFLEMLLQDVMDAGNFGRKQENRGVALRMVKKSNMLLSLAARTQDYFPLLKTYKLFLPFGMLAYAVRFCWLRLTGKREWVNSNALKQATQRKRLYEHFRLFEDDHSIQ